MRALAALTAATAAVFLAWTVGVGGHPLAWLFNDVVYNALIVAAIAAILLRAALGGSERLAWLVTGLGMLSWLGGELVTMLAPTAPPAIAELLFLLFYPAAYVAVALLVHERLRCLSASLALDGAIAALAVAAGAAALALEPILATAKQGQQATVLVNTAYPIGDLALLAMVVAVFGLSGWRPGRAWLLLGAGLALLAIADGVYLLRVARDSYVEGTPIDLLWAGAALLVAASAWQPARVVAEPRAEGLRVVVLPLAGTLVALGLLTFDHFERTPAAALWLIVATLLLAAARMALAFVDNQRMLALTREHALTDALTGLLNRRALMCDLERPPRPGEPQALIVFDLDGFKQYNDSFGHPAGDALLTRLGHRLAAAVAGQGRAYRLGGDEFCALVRLGLGGLEPTLAATRAALSERGEGFSIGASHGAVGIPDEAVSAADALRLADRRMYVRKGGRRASARRQSRDVLLTTLREREPELHRHLRDVAALSVMIARELRMSSEGLDEVARAAELHDIGKVAIPDAILRKPGPLDEQEWSFMRRHTLIGERILLSAPALRPVAGLVRSSHERWDGAGYPDGLGGDEIPLGARVVAVSDAFHAMTSARPYGPAISPAAALEELERRAGTQFDPAVVAAAARVLRAGDGVREPERAAV